MLERSRMPVMGNSRKVEEIEQKPGPTDYDTLKSDKVLKRTEELSKSNDNLANATNELSKKNKIITIFNIFDWINLIFVLSFAFFTKEIQKKVVSHCRKDK